MSSILATIAFCTAFYIATSSWTQHRWFATLCAFLILQGWSFLSNRSKLRTRAKYLDKNGIQSWPCVRSRWPGNLDVCIKMAHEFESTRPGQSFADLTLKYGHTFDINALGTSAIYTQDPEVVKHVLATRQSNYVKGKHLNDVFKDVLGTGIFNSDGEDWRVHRHAARPFFHKDNLADFTIFSEHCNTLVAAMKHKMETGPHGAVEIHNLVARFTLDAATDFLFGSCAHTLRAAISASDPAYLKAFESVQERLSDRLRAGFLWRVVQPSWPMRKDMAIVNQVVEEAIARVTETTEEAPSTGIKTLLSLLNKQEPQLTSAAKRDELLNVLMAARDTTASLLTSTIYELSRNQTIQTQAREEILSLLGKEGALAYDDVKSLKLVRAIIDETLRMYPPISANSRVALSDDVITTKGIRYFVPSGTHIGWSSYQMQQRLDIWGPDAKVWNPTRWLDHASVPANNAAAFQAWGIGPRICIGQDLAYLEATFVICRLLQEFDNICLAQDAQPTNSWVDNQVGGDIMPEAPVVTLSLRGGVWVKVG